MGFSKLRCECTPRDYAARAPQRPVVVPWAGPGERCLNRHRRGSYRVGARDQGRRRRAEACAEVPNWCAGFGPLPGPSFRGLFAWGLIVWADCSRTRSAGGLLRGCVWGGWLAGARRIGACGSGLRPACGMCGGISAQPLHSGRLRPARQCGPLARRSRPLHAQPPGRKHPSAAARSANLADDGLPRPQGGNAPLPALSHRLSTQPPPKGAPAPTPPTPQSRAPRRLTAPSAVPATPSPR